MTTDAGTVPAKAVIAQTGEPNAGPDRRRGVAPRQPDIAGGVRDQVAQLVGSRRRIDGDGVQERLAANRERGDLAGVHVIGNARRGRVSLQNDVAGSGGREGITHRIGRADGARLSR